LLTGKKGPPKSGARCLLSADIYLKSYNHPYRVYISTNFSTILSSFSSRRHLSGNSLYTCRSRCTGKNLIVYTSLLSVIHLGWTFNNTGSIANTVGSHYVHLLFPPFTMVTCRLYSGHLTCFDTSLFFHTANRFYVCSNYYANSNFSCCLFLSRQYGVFS